MLRENDVCHIFDNIFKEVAEKTLVNTVDMVEQFRAAIFDSRPVEQKRANDIRLSTDASACIMDLDFVAAVEQGKKKQKEKQKIAPKKRAMDEISNIPRRATKRLKTSFSSTSTSVV